MKTLILLALVIYWCWAGHGGIDTVGAAAHTLTAALGAATHAAHLCSAAQAHLGALRLPLPVGPVLRGPLSAGTHWD